MNFLNSEISKKLNSILKCTDCLERFAFRDLKKAEFYFEVYRLSRPFGAMINSRTRLREATAQRSGQIGIFTRGNRDGGTTEMTLDGAVSIIHIEGFYC